MGNGNTNRKILVRQSNLETANAMFKNAFLVKKTRFAKENPHLNEAELNKFTADYIRGLSNDPERKRRS
jgi:hypothetical protein